MVGEQTFIADTQRDVLLQELHHRFYNSLQLISSMAGRIVHGDAEQNRRTVQALQHRVGLLAQLHRLLAFPIESGSGLRENCAVICRGLLSSFARDDAALRLHVEALEVTPARARYLMLLMVELVTNALKHSGPASAVLIEVELGPGPLGCALGVRSNGGGGSPTRAPRVATHVAESVGGFLTVTGGDTFDVRVDLPV